MSKRNQDSKARKRGQNEGTIYRRLDGRWCGAISLGYKNGRMMRKYFYGKTRGEVQKLLTKALHDQNRGLPVAVERQTVAQFLRRWLDDHVKPSVRDKTLRSYEQTFRLYLEPKLGHVILEKLAPQHVQKMMSELTQEVSVHCARYSRTVLRCALGKAMKWNLVARNVATLVDPPHVRRGHVNPWTPEEARCFLDAIKGDRLETLFSVALALGLRRGEALGLRWEDIDFEKRALRVVNQLQRTKGRMQLVELKSDSSHRTLTLPEVAVSSLRAHRVRQLEEKMAAGSGWTDSDFVFTTTIGTPIDERNLLRRFRALTTKAGLRRQRFHDLRHCAASLLLAKGVPSKVVQEILGHSSIALTLNTYSHVMPSLKQEAADLMDAVLTEEGS